MKTSRPCHSRRKRCHPVKIAKQILPLLLLILNLSQIAAFSPSFVGYKVHPLRSRLFLSAQSQQEQQQQKQNDSQPVTNPSDMKIGEIKSELKELGVSFSDCFDRESLTKRLGEARTSAVTPSQRSKEENESTHGVCTPPPPATPSRQSKEENVSTQSVRTPSPPQNNDETPPDDSSSSNTPSNSQPFDREKVESELNSLRVRDLKTRLSEKNIRWGNMIEKGDMVRALVDAEESAFNFSSSGVLIPGRVNDVTSDVLDEELNGGMDKLIFLDVYATWCGPCQLIAKEMVGVSAELGDRVRVMKMDSDKNQSKAGMLKVGGLPTLILFDGKGNELERFEGALRGEDILELIGKHLD